MTEHLEAFDLAEVFSDKSDSSTSDFASTTPLSERPPYLNLSTETVSLLVDCARDPRPVQGLTHSHYKYPARFSPWLVRGAIDAFTRPGDLVVDPFVGGGTTMVEALASGRDVVGSDISSLAVFVAEAKTLEPSRRDLRAFTAWLVQLPDKINMRAASSAGDWWEEAGYVRNLQSKGFWRLRKAIGQLLEGLSDLPPMLKHLRDARFFERVIGLWTLERLRRP